MSTEAAPKLLLNPREAAKVLSISPATLWRLSMPRGPIPCIRIGDGARPMLRYPLVGLERFISEFQAARVAL